MRIVLAVLILLLGQGQRIDWKSDEKLPQKRAISEAQVDTLGLRYYRARFFFDPAWATAKGFHGHDDKLPTYFKRRIHGFLMKTKRSHAGLDRIVEDSLGIDKWIDYKALLADMDTQIFLLEELEIWKSWPTLYADGCIHGIYALLMSPERASLNENLASRLRQIPEVVSRARENLTSPSKLHCEVASRSLRDFVPFVEGLGRAEGISLDATLVAESASALQGFADYLDSLAVGADPDFALGYDNFVRLLDLKYMIKDDPEDLVAYAERVLERARKRREELPRAPDEVPFDTTAALALTPEGVLDYYRVEAESAMAFIERRELMTLPAGSRLEIASTPAFLRSLIPGYAYHPPGPLDEDQVGRLYVPLPGMLGADAKLAYHWDFVHGRLKGAVIHETFPGHHLQLTAANRSESFIRKMQGDNFTIEGWALYCEDLMAEAGYGGPAQMRRALDGIIFRAARVIVDVRLQLGVYSLEEAIDFMINETGASPGYIEREVRRYAVEPGQPMSYIIGKREIERLRDDVKGDMGDVFTLKEFHDNLLSCGSIQLYLLRACVMSKS